MLIAGNPVMRPACEFGQLLADMSVMLFDRAHHEDENRDHEYDHPGTLEKFGRNNDAKD